jgi:hypothetical protein
MTTTISISGSSGIRVGRRIEIEFAAVEEDGASLEASTTSGLGGARLGEAEAA